MIDEEKVRKLKQTGFGLLACFTLLIGFGIGQTTAKPEAKESKETSSSQESETQTLTHKKVKEFLTAYYTKKDLGTNRNRYKPFMSKELYTQETSKEEEAVNQAYKGYVVDFAFKEADIYINSKTNIAIAQVTYTNTLLAKKNNYDKAQKNVSNQTTLKLSYILDTKGKLKLNQIQPALLTLNGEEETNLPDYGTLTETSIETTEEGEN